MTSNRNIIETIARQSSWSIRRTTIAIISLGFRHGISLQFAVYLAGQARCHRLPRSFHREPGEPRYRDDPNIYPNVSHESLITSCRAEHFFVRGPLRSIGSHLNTGSSVVDRCRMIERFASIGYRSMIPFWAALQELHERWTFLNEQEDLVWDTSRRVGLSVLSLRFFFELLEDIEIFRYSRRGQRLELGIENWTERFEKWPVVK